MSVTTIRNTINRINGDVVDLKKNQAKERKKELDIEGKINDLQIKIVKSKNLIAAQRFQKQIDAKSKELSRVSRKVKDYQIKITQKGKQLAKEQGKLSKELEKETKKSQNSELTFMRRKNQLNKSELGTIRNASRELQRQQQVFRGYAAIDKQDLSGNDEEYDLKELDDLYSCIDDALSQLEKLGLGQEIIFSEIEELKSKSRKITKKDLKMMLIGKLVSFGAGKMDTSNIAQVFETITDTNLTKLLAE